MTTRIHSVNTNHNANMQTIIKTPVTPVPKKAFPSVMFHSTIDNWEWASESARVRDE
jgi:hypothetical protein